MITFRSDFHRLTFCLPTEHTAIHAAPASCNRVAGKKSGGRKKKTPSSDTTPPEQRELYGESITGFSEVIVNLNVIRGLCYDAARSKSQRVHAGPVTVIFRGERTVITEKELTNHA